MARQTLHEDMTKQTPAVPQAQPRYAQSSPPVTPATSIAGASPVAVHLLAYSCSQVHIPLLFLLRQPGPALAHELHESCMTG